MAHPLFQSPKPFFAGKLTLPGGLPKMAAKKDGKKSLLHTCKRKKEAII
jgi:hypothetical protein